jgi:hypothetical protein
MYPLLSWMLVADNLATELFFTKEYILDAPFVMDNAAYPDLVVLNCDYDLSW